MMCLVRLKNINILLLAVLLLWSCMCAVCGATEKTYTITESQLTTLETNLTEQKNKSYTIGVGGGSNGLGLYASKDKTWMYLDKDTATIGWQIKF